MLINRIPPGVDDAAKVKADFINAIAQGKKSSNTLTPEKAAEILGTMGGGYNIQPLVDLLDNEQLASIAVNLEKSV